jgi:CRISPR-associated protein (TIGR02584 family)
MGGKKTKTSAGSRRAETGPPTILIAVSGMSPAIITETVWAMAHDEQDPCLPTRVVAITTRAGAAAIRQQLFAEDGAPCAWDALRQSLARAGHAVDGLLQFGDTPNDIQVFESVDPATGRTGELDDIRSPADNAQAADFLLRQLRPWTENREIRIVASIAGGRKTMSALLYACMSLVGREQDRVTHVLVNEPFDRPLDPPFIFPGQAEKFLTAPDGSKHACADARVELADIPFVPLRNAFQQLAGPPGSFRQLVDQYRDAVLQPEPVSIRLGQAGVTVDGVEVRLRPREQLLLRYLVEINQDEDNPVRTPADAVEGFFEDFLPRQPGREAAEWAKLNTGNDEIRNKLNKIRDAMRRANVAWMPSPERTSGMILPAFELVGEDARDVR